MKLVLVAIINNQNGSRGYRVVDIDNQTYRDVDEKYLLSHLDYIDTYNLKVKKDKIIGDFDNYTKIMDGRVVGKEPYVVLARIILKNKIIAYKVVNWAGKVYELSKYYLDNHAREHGVVNGVFSETQGGDECFVYGDFDTIEYSYAGLNSFKINVDVNTIDAKITTITDEKRSNIQRIQTNFGYVQGWFQNDATKYFWLEDIYVHFQYRGNGVATYLFTKLAEYLHDIGVKEIRVGVDCPYCASFWISLGFRVQNYMHDRPDIPDSAILYYDIKIQP